VDQSKTVEDMVKW